MIPQLYGLFLHGERDRCKYVERRAPITKPEYCLNNSGIHSPLDKKDGGVMSEIMEMQMREPYCGENLMILLIQLA